MLLHENRAAGSSCRLERNDALGWLHATWTGYVDHAQAVRGAERYLHTARAHPWAYLLNDNTLLRGPRFGSIAWLEQVWVPQAVRLGLRYGVHVLQHNDPMSYGTTHRRNSSGGQFELPLFEHVRDAKEWLHTCQQAAAAT